MKYLAGLALAIALCAGVGIIAALIAWRMRREDRREKIELPHIKYGEAHGIPSTEATSHPSADLRSGAEGSSTAQTPPVV